MDLWGALCFVGVLVTAVYDAKFTVRRMLKYGAIVETNPGIGLLGTSFGPLGVWVGVLVPTLALLIPATLYSRLGLGVLFGIRLCLFKFQRISLRLETEMDKLSAKNPTSPPHW